MPDRFIVEKLEYILEHAEKISVYFKGINDPQDFRSSGEGDLKLDAITARLNALAENFKKIEKLQPGFTSKNITAGVEKIIKFRDFISHHYEKLDNVIIFEICRDKIPALIIEVKNYLENR